LNYSSIVCQ
jgi:hypothetical protein